MTEPRGHQKEADVATSTHPLDTLCWGGEKLKRKLSFFLPYTLAYVCLRCARSLKRRGGINDDLDFDVLYCNLFACASRVAHNDDVFRGLSGVF